jgi:ubiquinone/menaquinone biosynthesis C-methylase UbiE
MGNRERTQAAQSSKGQVSSRAAEVYEESFVPALFQPWAPRMADAAHIAAGQRVLDVATGTGILARTVAERVGPAGSVVGLDINDGMLAVARRVAPHIEWRLDRAEALPFGDSSFDAVVSQFGLMFFEDKPGALREMWRVLRPGGRLAVAVWDSVENAPGIRTLMGLLQEYGGQQAADGLRAPFSLGDTDLLRRLFEDAGIPDARIMGHPGQARYPSIDSWMYTNTKGWVFADLFDDAQYERLLRAANEALAGFVMPDGTVVFDIPAYIITASKPGSNGRNP